MIFSYTVRSNTGEITEGVQEAPDRFSLARDFRARGFFPISITEKTNNFEDIAARFLSMLSRVKMSEQIIFTKNLSGMLKAGLSISRALSVLEKQTKNQKLNKIIKSLASEISAGATLSYGLAQFPDVFSPLFISMTKAGEESGNLSGSLSDIGQNLEKAHSLTRKIHGALVYPGVIMSAMVIIGILMFAFVVPTLAATFKELGVTLPLSTRIIIWFGNFFSNNLILTFVGVIGLAFGFYSLIRAKFMEPFLDLLIVKLPVVGNIVKELNTARTARSMASLLLAGVTLTRAIEITEDVVQNLYYKKVLKNARVAVEKGAPFSALFEENENLYPIMMAEMIQVGEETGKLSDMLGQIADFYEGEIESKTKNLSTIIEPILMIFIGAGVGFFAISMISPLYSVLDNIK